MEPDSRFREMLDLAARAAEAVYDHDSNGRAQAIEIDDRGLEAQLDRMAELDGHGYSANVLVNSGGDVAVKFQNSNTGHTIVALRGTDGLGDVVSWPTQGAGVSGDLSRKTVRALEGEPRVDLIVGHSWGGYEASNVGRRIDQAVGYVVNFQGPEINDIVRAAVQFITKADVGLLQGVKQFPTTVIIKSSPADLLQTAIQSLGFEGGAYRYSVPTPHHNMIDLFEYITGKPLSETKKLRAELEAKRDTAADAARNNVELGKLEREWGHEPGSMGRVNADGTWDNRTSGGQVRQESWADRHGGGAGDSGRVGGATPTKSTTTTVTKNSDGYTKTTETTKYSSGVTQTTTKQTVMTPHGPEKVTKTTTSPVSKPKDDPRKTGPQPILLDLDGDGVKITEFDNSTRFMTGKDGFQHRSSWAGAGDGVLFYDPDGRNAITEHRQYVFTEWTPTAAGGGWGSDPVHGGQTRMGVWNQRVGRGR